MGCLKLSVLEENYIPLKVVHKRTDAQQIKRTGKIVGIEKKGVAGYVFGFNGKEMDNEVSGQGNQYDYGFRIYNPRLGKFLSVDPLTQSYPWYTPYQFAGNKVIRFIDLDGLEEYDPMQEDDNTSALYTITGETVEEIFGYNKDQAVTYERDKKGNYQYTRVTYSRKHGKAIKTNIDPKSGLYGRSLQLGVKMFKDDELHHKLFKHFLIAKGGEYLLSPKEVNGMPMQPFDLSGMVMTVADRENADAKINMNTTVASAFKENTKLSGKTLKGTLNSMKVGASQQFTTSFETTSNPLGESTITITGTLTKNNFQNGYSFSGHYQITDLYNFDPRLYNSKDKLRSTSGEAQVKVMWFLSFFAKKSAFEVKSEQIPMTDSKTCLECPR